MPRKADRGSASDPVRARMDALLEKASKPVQKADPVEAETPVEVLEDQPLPAPTPPIDELPARRRPRRQVDAHGAAPVRTTIDRRFSGSGEKIVNRKIRFGESEARENDDLVALISRLTGGKPGHSVITRVLWYLLREAEDTLKRRRREIKRPPKGYGIELHEYEQELARYLLSGLKDVDL